MSSRATARVPVSPRTPSARSVPVRTTPRTTPRSHPRPQLSVVAPPAPRPRRSARTALRNRRAPFVLLVVALLAGTALGLLVLNTAIAVDSLEATRLRADNAQRAQDVQRLEQRVIDGNTPAAIAQAAVAAGLVPAAGAAYLVLDPEGAPVLRGEPVPAEAPPAPPAPAPAERPAGGN
ncbi:hypothetical protein SAMN05660662_2627 [Blastococcus aurantiacus]|uniref:Cell division protein FtsB n=1 Tax=Blastococcus aurantiacus TaxID=1550231 RepID=A0A1G7M1G3_9ACTN|nr:hypothetical protein [Blastococcus aurantiacus]SDF55587.1 hypothetical protein SAMN05660662_2627 [Blastococcus aurantiacus]